MTAAAPPLSVDAAWQEAEAALPEGWELAQVTRVRLRGLESMQRWGAMAAPIIPKGRRWRRVVQFGEGSTPAGALRALAAQLLAMRSDVRCSICWAWRDEHWIGAPDHTFLANP